MRDANEKFLLPSQIERHLAALSKLYALEGKRELQTLVVNAQTRVHEGMDYDNWNGGTYGHALYLQFPEQIYIKSVRNREAIQARIQEDLNNIQNVPNEHISAVFIEMTAPEKEDWRTESGLLLLGRRSVSDEACQRIWKEGYFRLFLSHKSEEKVQIAALKEALQAYGISSFVAHEDIHPTEEWQNEIENALATMDGFLAAMTTGFHHSDWTDQEVGFAFARRVPMIALRLGKDPYGFIGKFQGLRASWEDAPLEIAKILIKNERMFAAWLHAIRNCFSYDHGNTLGKLLPSLSKLAEEQIDELIDAYNDGGQATGSYAFNGGKPRDHGKGLLHHVNQLSSRSFIHSGSKIVEEKNVS
jgi:hypothetical protein